MFEPPRRPETVKRTRPLGRSFDPRVAVIRDTLEPELIAEPGINKGGESRADCRQDGRHLIGRISRVEAIGVEVTLSLT